MIFHQFGHFPVKKSKNLGQHFDKGYLYSRKLERISASMEVLLTELVSFRCHHSQR